MTITRPTTSGVAESISNLTIRSSSFDGIDNNNGTTVVTNGIITGSHLDGIENIGGPVTVTASIVTANEVRNINRTFTDGGHDLTSGNAMLGILGNYGGPTRTFPLARFPRHRC